VPGWDEILSGMVHGLQLILSGDPGVIQITLLSLRVSGGATLLGALVGISLGALLSLADFRGRTFVVALVNTMTGLPPVVVGLVLYLLLSSSGPLGFLKLLYTPEAMVVAQLIMVIPIVASITLSAISSVDQETKQAVRSLGASPFRELLIILNEARVGLLTSVVVGFGSAISEVGAIMMVGGNLLGHTRALTTAVVLLTNQGEFAQAIALGMVLLALGFSVNVLLMFLRGELFSGTLPYLTARRSGPK